MNKKIVTRFAPSPTGMLHIGGARTALFNYLLARSQGGKYLLRIEDTDKARSTKEAELEILESLKWLGIEPDEAPFYQSKNEARHREVAEELIRQGKAYYCYASKEELDELRKEAEEKKQRYKYDRRWRDRDASDAPSDIKPVVRIKAPLDGVIEFDDKVQGKITIKNEEQDDFIILRSDGSPTYMLAVVVDDHDMGVTHVMRGDDHLANCSKQIILYQALGWDVPIFAHIPLIYGPDGKKMSKRHGATAASEYRDLGYLPEAMRNYLLRLGFSHGDDEIISDQEAIKWFSLDNLGKSPARFDFKKLENLNAHYLRETEDQELIDYIIESQGEFSALELNRLTRLMPEIKLRANLLPDLLSSTEFLRENFIVKENLTDKAIKALDASKEVALDIVAFIKNCEKFDHESLYEACKNFAEENNIKVKIIAGFIRSKITASHISPSIFEIMEIFGKDEIIKRLEND